MNTSTPRQTVRETAAGWHDRLHRDKVSEDTRVAFARWLNESPEHRTVYEQVERTWSDLKSVAHDPRILALRHETALRVACRTSQRIRPLVWAAAALILVVLATTLATLGGHPTSNRSLLASLAELFHVDGDGHYSTKIGERLTVTLADGSQLTLNTQTDLNVAFTRTERTVHINRGQALFEVAKDPARPFVVEAINRRFIAVGTAFDVRLDGQQLNLTMIEGTVRVERKTNRNPEGNSTSMAERSGLRDAAREQIETPVLPPPLVTTLTAGEQLTVDSQSRDHVRSTDPERVTSWRRGQVIFEDTRLADAIAELNRYSAAQIELADPALAELRLSGAFATGRPTVFVEAITTYFPIEITRADDRTVILSARK